MRAEQVKKAMLWKMPEHIFSHSNDEAKLDSWQNLEKNVQETLL